MTRDRLADPDGALAALRFLVVDRDTKFTAEFCRIVEGAGINVVRTAYQAPNMNAIAERWVRSAKSECLDRLILFGTRHLERALREFVAQYHTERPVLSENSITRW